MASQAIPKASPRKTAAVQRATKANGRCQRAAGAHRGCGASSGKAIGAADFSPLSIGIRVIATTSEVPTASAMVSAWSRNSCPAMPSTNTSGRNTAITVRVDATTAMPTSRVPAMAASMMPSPRSRALAMLSSTTIESSTTRPVASASPPSDITLRLSPSWSMKKNVATIETGSDTPTTKVLQPLRRNRKMIRIASVPPSTASVRTSEIAARMNRAWSSTTSRRTPGGSSLRRRCRRSSTAAAVATVLASPSL